MPPLLDTFLSHKLIGAVDSTFKKPHYYIAAPSLSPASLLKALDSSVKDLFVMVDSKHYFLRNLDKQKKLRLKEAVLDGTFANGMTMSDITSCFESSILIK
mmetsp:Transcript_18692/g.21490  ORF Transcript_18692/g.21490 Transcript_18692/m.21490 type:complete len:101 (-) Transcript_18692:46-348(-)